VESRKIRFYPHAGPGLGQGPIHRPAGLVFFFATYLLLAGHCAQVHILNLDRPFSDLRRSYRRLTTSPHLTATHRQSHCRPPRPSLQPPVLIPPQPPTITLTSSDAAVIDVNVSPGVATTTPESDSPTGRSLIGRGSHTELSAQESFRFEYSLWMKLVDVTIN
jgi:hypothetical protein